MFQLIMSLTRIIGISTGNQIKVNEIKADFESYGIQSVQVPWPLEPLDKEKFFGTNILEGKQFKPLGIVREESKLVLTNNPNQTITSEQLTQMLEVTHISILEVYFPDSSKKLYSNYVNGYIDLTRKTGNPDVFDWDDVFVVSAINKTYWELKQLNRKYSARDNCIAQYIADSIHYKTPLDLKHYPQNYTRCIDFSKDPAKFILGVKQFSNKFATKLNLSNIPINALNNGMFFRSAKNRRQKLYWCPGLNAGIPFVPKPKDPAHELTFMFHDFSHFAIPDLIFDGIDTPLAQKVYIGYRLMSEAFTLVLGDMLFVHSMIKSGYDYETVSGRKIYPIFTQMVSTLFDKSTPQIESIKTLLIGSFQYCFYGDTTIWEKFMETGEKTNKVLAEFSNKYDAYFIEDFRWTNLNWNYMKSNKKEYAEWWNQIDPIIKAHKLKLYSVSEWIEKFNLSSAQDTNELNRMIFESVFDTWIKPLLSKPIELESQESRLKSMFIRYMLGQSEIFFHFNKIDLESDSYWSSIVNTLNYLVTNPVTDSIINGTRNYYKKYLENLLGKSLISVDDFNTYQEIYPIFKPVIVDYDNLEESRTLAEFSELMLTT